ncbi:MAG: hypothetical protein HFG26_01305 [Provencibacterium sp.]|jgi:hypothetical protein|nr:hypothetical protein [Provencibacterium sp.]
MSEIKIAKASNLNPQYENGVSRQSVLTGEYRDAAFYKVSMQPGADWKPELFAFGDRCQMLVFMGGTGYITTPKKAFNIQEVSLFVPDFDHEEFVVHASGELECLQIVASFSDYDRKDIAATHISLPRFRPLSAAWTYEEHFKTPGITSYMFIEHRNFGRMSMGVVTGVGPGVVGQHIHNELQQWYFALPGAESVCVSGEQRFPFEGGDVCYFPMGTYHGSEVEADKRFDYVWFEMCEDGYPGQIL